jgi:hypothetical protein
MWRRHTGVQSTPIPVDFVNGLSALLNTAALLAGNVGSAKLIPGGNLIGMVDHQSIHGTFLLL